MTLFVLGKANKRYHTDVMRSAGTDSHSHQHVSSPQSVPWKRSGLPIDPKLINEVPRCQSILPELGFRAMLSWDIKARAMPNVVSNGFQGP